MRQAVCKRCASVIEAWAYNKTDTLWHCKKCGYLKDGDILLDPLGQGQGQPNVRVTEQKHSTRA